MEENFENYWDNCHIKYNTSTIINDNWLDKYLPTLKKINTANNVESSSDNIKKDFDFPVLDLGCGLGNNAKYLLDRGYEVIATDYSEVALDFIKNKLPKAKVLKLDLTKKFPFKDNSFYVIIADLCLHYFSKDMTQKIMQEIKRVLRRGGVLLARVNSVNDFNSGAGQGIKLEENFYFTEGYNKRFFSYDDAKYFFEIIGKTDITYGQMLRYTKPKEVVEIRTVKGN